MNAKRACLVALMLTLTGVGTAHAQYPSGAANSAPSPLPTPGPIPAAVDAPVPPPTGPRLSDYILGTTPDCCGPVGGDGPISTELYVRWGPSVNLPTGYLSKELETGWEVQGGGRVLFFNPEGDAAWTVDLSISNINDHGQHSDRPAVLGSLLVAIPNGFGGTTPMRIFDVPVTIRSLNRTFANAGLGREWYLWAPGANCPNCGRMTEGPTWRVGLDAGGRWGSESMEFHEIKHRTEVIEGLYASIHTDLEIPCGGWIFVIGGRIEWDNTWMHTILQDIPENLQNINILMTLGVRY